MRKEIHRAIGLWLLLVSNALAIEGGSNLPLPTSTLDSNQLRLGVGASYLNTSGNRNATANSVALANKNSFQSIKPTAFFHYGLLQNTTLLAEIEMVLNQAKSTSMTTGARATNSTNGLGDARLGARQKIELQPVRVFADMVMQLPLYKRLSSAQWSKFSLDSPGPLGNGVLVISALAAAEINFMSDFWSGLNTGFSWRGGGFSSLLHYGAYAKLEQKRGLFAKLGVLGQASITDDQHTAMSSAAERSTNAIAGSSALNAINPSSLSIDAVLGLHLASQWWLGVGAQMPFAGKNIARDPVYTASVGLLLGSDAQDSEGKPKMSQAPKAFKQYQLSARVIETHESLGLVLIDRGNKDGLKVGDSLDIFEPDADEGQLSEIVAEGKIVEIGPTRSKLEVQQRFKDETIQEGFVVRKPVR